MLNVFPDPIRSVLLLGAHCDDIAIGAGGTVLQLCRAHPGVTITAYILTGGGTVREKEERAALEAFCPGARLEIEVADLEDGRMPARWEQAKSHLEALRTRCSPDLIVGPSTHDAHQDHRTLAELVPTVFRDHLVFGYEIPKWDGDLLQPQAFVPLSEAEMQAKVATLHEHYGSQLDRPWFDEESFLGLARIRGIQCRSRYAEGFHIPKLAVRMEGGPDVAPVSTDDRGDQ